MSAVHILAWPNFSYHVFPFTFMMPVLNTINPALDPSGVADGAVNLL